MLSQPRDTALHEGNGTIVNGLTSSGLEHPAIALIHSEGREPSVVAFEREVVAFFLDAADILGVPKSVAAIYGLCFATPQPLCFGDLNARLEISAGSISQGVRILREVGALKVVGAHDRREFLVPDLELRKLALRYVEERVTKQLDAGKTRLQAMKSALPSDQIGQSKELKARLKYLQSWHDKSRAVVPLLKGFLNVGL